MILTVYTDGGSLNNPGQAAIGYLIYNETSLLIEESQSIGIATNNFAEYTALIRALTKILDLKAQGIINTIEKITCIADSELMVKQLNGLYKVKHENMRELLMKVRIIENQLNVPIYFTHVLREKNKQADALVKKSTG